MQSETDAAMNFFDYLMLAKRERQSLIAQHPELESLSGRELEILAQLLSDKTQGEIAKELCLSASGIHFHCKNIYRKLGINSRKQLLMHYKDLY